MHPEKGDNSLNNSLNCGTWLTYFLQLNPNFNSEYFTNFYGQHMKYMFGTRLLKAHRRIHITLIKLTKENGKIYEKWHTIRYTEPQIVVKGSHEPISILQKYKLRMEGYDYYKMKPEDF